MQALAGMAAAVVAEAGKLLMNCRLHRLPHPRTLAVLMHRPTFTTLSFAQAMVIVWFS